MTTELTLENDIFDGTESNDTILGLNGNDILRGLEGNDILNGNQDNDRIFGNQGNDTLYGGKNDDIVMGGKDNDQVFGDLGNDTLWGDDADDLVFGGLGDDLVYGNRGNDLLTGNEGDDTIYGGKDNDTLFGDSGDDLLSGDLGNDLLFSDEGIDTIEGGLGNDIFVLEEKFAANAIQESDVIQDFSNGRDKIGLTNGLVFGQLAISVGVSEFLGDTIIQEKNTGRYLAVLKNVDSTTIDESDFTTDLTPVGSSDQTDQEEVIDPTSGEDSLSFELAEYGFAEGGAGGSLTITVQRDGPARGIATIDYITVEGTARAGSDFDATGGNLIFNPGEFTKTFDVTIREDFIREGEESFSVQLRNPFGSAVIGTPDTATIAIIDNEDLPAVQFSSDNYSVSETDGSANITVTVNSVSETPFTVDYGTRDRTATLTDNDYQEATGTLNFLPGQTTQSFSVPILTDNIDDPNETITLFLINPSNGATLGSPTDAILTIL